MASFEAWERSRSGRAFGSYLDAMDTLCLRTVSMEWNVPEKYGPHGVLFFFLIQKKPAIAPNSETSLFSAGVLKKCALIALHTMEEMEMDVKSPSWEKNGKWAAQRVQSGRVKAKLGRKTKVCLSSGSCEGNVRNDALNVIGLHGPGDKISLFLQDWELVKALRIATWPWTCLCQEMHEAWKGDVATR